MTAEWRLSHQADPTAKALADRHYYRKRPDSPQFMPPGRQLVLVTMCGRALWATSWPRADLVKRGWPTAWVCAIFRNEGAGLSSDLIRQAIAVTRWKYGDPPPDGMITFVNADLVRHKRDPGRCFRRAGFVPVGYTQRRGLLILRLAPELMPEPTMPLGATLALPFAGLEAAG